MLKNIMNKVDCLLIGGGMSATFLKAKSYDVGTSVVEEESIEIAGELMRLTEKNNVKLVLPVDVVVSDKIDSQASGSVVSINAVPPDKKIVDIGPETIAAFRQEMGKSRTLFWNGPMGIQEIPQFAVGTETLAKVLPMLQSKTVVGGGSTAEVIQTLASLIKLPLSPPAAAPRWSSWEAKNYPVWYHYWIRNE
jgi:phosphoglycerate kinase